MKSMRRLAMATLTLIITLLMLGACYIEPPLHLAERGIVIEYPIVETELEIIWDVDVDWRTEWFYNWDSIDIKNWGEIGYTAPVSYKVFRYYQEDTPGKPHEKDKYDMNTYFSTTFRDRFSFGYYDMLIYSNIESPTQEQVVVIDYTSDLDNVTASTTTRSRSIGFPAMTSRGETNTHYNQPEIFYAAYSKNIFISRDTADYDYVDPVTGYWVKKLNARLMPRVYIYLVQVVLHNNKGRVLRTAGSCGVNALSIGTSVNTGHTFVDDVDVLFDMRLKNNMAYKNNETVDIIGGKLTTYGLCDMDAFEVTRSKHYSGSRSDLRNRFAVNLGFNNADSVYYYDITEQMQRQAHGGVVTVEIDIDTLKIPKGKHTPTGGGGFDPYIDDYADGPSREFDL